MDAQSQTQAAMLLKSNIICEVFLLQHISSLDQSHMFYVLLLLCVLQCFWWPVSLLSTWDRSTSSTSATKPSMWVRTLEFSLCHQEQRRVQRLLIVFVSAGRAGQRQSSDVDSWVFRQLVPWVPVLCFCLRWSLSKVRLRPPSSRGRGHTAASTTATGVTGLLLFQVQLCRAQVWQGGHRTLWRGLQKVRNVFEKRPVDWFPWLHVLPSGLMCVRSSQVQSVGVSAVQAAPVPGVVSGGGGGDAAPPGGQEG